MSQYSQIDPGTGALLTYNDPFADVTPAMIDQAIQAEAEIITHVGTLQKTYIQLGVALSNFEEKRLYLAREHDSFRAWAKSPHIGIDYRTAHDLIRIVREALPILMENDMMDMLPPVSKMRALLPTLADGEEVFLEAVEATRDATVADTYNIIDEIRGIEKNPEKKPFRAIVKMGDKQHNVKLVSTNPNNSYTLGFLNIAKEDWGKFESLLGNRVEFDLSSKNSTGYSPS